MTPLEAALSKPLVWTFEEAASLIGLNIRTFQRRVQSGEIVGHIPVTYIRPPGTAHAYRRARGRVSSQALVDYLRAQEAKTAERRKATLSTARRRTPRPKAAAQSPSRFRGTTDTPSTPSLDASET